MTSASGVAVSVLAAATSGSFGATLATTGVSAASTVLPETVTAGLDTGAVGSKESSVAGTFTVGVTVGVTEGELDVTLTAGASLVDFSGAGLSDTSGFPSSSFLTTTNGVFGLAVIIGSVISGSSSFASLSAGGSEIILTDSAVFSSSLSSLVIGSAALRTIGS